MSALPLIPRPVTDRAANLQPPITRTTIVALITMGSILMSLAITYVGLKLQESAVTFNIMLIAFIAPLVIAPIVSWRLMSLLIKIHRLEQEMRLLATYDDMTGTLNRRAFLSSAEQTLQIARRNHFAIALMYMDIDNFKNINDTHGHNVGDTVIRSFASVLTGLKRNSDLLGRVGGEEFALMILNTDREGTLHFAGKVLEEVRNNVVHHQGIEIRNTVSIGVAMLDQEQKTTLDQLIHRADKALYKAKHTGKDRVAMDDESLPPSTAQPHASAGNV